MNRAAAWIELKKFRPALSDCKEGLELEGNSPHARYLIRLARCELALGNPRAALGSLDKVLSNDPDDSAASALKASAWSLHEQLWIYSRARKDKDYAAARSALMCARTHCNDPPQSWLYWAIEVELAGREWDQAEKMIKSVFPSWFSLLASQLTDPDS
jgi:DnaJ family protein C protein 7